MQSIHYDIYSISTKGLRKREISSILEGEPTSFAYLAESHISISKSSGYSFVDMIIGEVEKDSFVYIGKTLEDTIYLLIYTDKLIVFSGVVEPIEIDTKLALYASKIDKDTTYFLYKYYNDNLKEKETRELTQNLYHQDKLDPFKLKSVTNIKTRVNPQAKVIILWAAIIGLIIAGTVGIIHNRQANETAEMQARNRVIHDPWHEYRNYINKPSAYNTVKTIFTATNDIREVGMTAIRSMRFNGNTITLYIANFGHSSYEFSSWSKQHHYNLISFDQSKFLVTKRIYPHKTPYGNKIMLVKQIKQKLIDRINQLNDQNIQVNFSNSGSEHLNFQVINATLNVQETPIHQIIDLMHSLNAYPITTTQLTGSTTLGTFSGNISLNIIGD